LIADLDGRGEIRALAYERGRIDLLLEQDLPERREKRI
jgi:hypothetical protein